MESLNLNTLASSLPTASLANAEKDLLNSFKAAALSITTLYRSSRYTSKRAYNAGYAAACQDLLVMIQQGVSVGGGGASASSEESGLTIGRVMDWIEARLDAIKAREEEEDEDEEKAISSTTAPKNDVQGAKAPTATSSSSSARHKDGNRPQPLAENTNTNNTNTNMTAHSTTSSQPSSSPLLPLRHIHPVPQVALRLGRVRPNVSAKLLPTVAIAASATDSVHSYPSPPILLTPHPQLPLPSLVPATSPPPTEYHPHPEHQHQHQQHQHSVGVKKRHAVMMMLDPTSTASPLPAVSLPTAQQHPQQVIPQQTQLSGGSVAGNGTSSRRRKRSVVGSRYSQSDSMDVEEEAGRERKRPARR